MLYNLSRSQLDVILSALSLYSARKNADVLLQSAQPDPFNDSTAAQYQHDLAQKTISHLSSGPFDLESHILECEDAAKSYRESGDTASAECAVSSQIALSNVLRSALAKDILFEKSI